MTTRSTLSGSRPSASRRLASRSLVVKRLEDWVETDKKAEYPWDWVKTFGEAGWLGMIIPEEYGGSGLGVTEATIMLHEVCASGAGTSGASPIHFYLFPPMPVIKHGAGPLKAKYLPRIATGEIVMSFGVTEPNADRKSVV